jgi:hypothetical protein
MSVRSNPCEFLPSVALYQNLGDRLSLAVNGVFQLN